MAKSKQTANKPKSTKQSSNEDAAKNPAASTSSRKSVHTLSDLLDDRDLRYRICVLIYDLHNIKNDKMCQRRTELTTDAQYISAPYFSDEEAAIVKAAVVSPGVSIEQAIQNEFKNFGEKRQASGDFRPCGPHDMVLAYLSCFGIDKAEIEDEQFVSRLKRSGLGCS